MTDLGRTARLDVLVEGYARLPNVAGTVSLVLGILFLAATVFTYVLSLTDLVDPPNWVRAAGLVWLPIGFVGTPIAYALARTGPGRDRGRVGLVAGLVGLLAFVLLVLAVG